MGNLNLFDDTYFLFFAFSMLIIYGGVMFLIMSYVRRKTYKRYLDRIGQRNPRDSNQPRQLSESEWMDKYDVMSDPDYIFAWGVASRSFSSIHAVVMVTTVCCLISRFGIAALWDYNFYFYHSDGMVVVRNLNAFMVAYLCVDLIFLIVHYLQQLFRSKGTADDNFIFAVLHHAVGAISMLQFVKMGVMPFNSLYFSYTEISTITLNIAWLAVKMGWDRDPDLKIIYQVAAGLTWLLFLFVRVFGSAALIFYLYYYRCAIAALPPSNWLFAYGANPLIIGLNYYWFYKLTRKALEVFAPPVKAKAT